jgi:hypothetical protein
VKRFNALQGLLQSDVPDAGPHPPPEITTVARDSSTFVNKHYRPVNAEVVFHAISDS